MKLTTDGGIEINLEKIQTLQIKKDEILILTTKERLAMEAIESMKVRLKKIFGNTKIVILDNGLEFHLVKENNESLQSTPSL